MRIEVRDVAQDGSNSDVRLCTHIMDGSEELLVKERPLVLVCPGGAYAMTSDREADAVAVQFNAMGFHSAVLRYSVAPAEYPTAILELADSLLHIRKNARKWRVDPNKIIIVGFSAGAHLVCSYCCFWKEAFISEKLGLSPERLEELRPNGMILGYPVITSGEFTHVDSIDNLLGRNAGDTKLRAKVSLEDQISDSVPRTFIWHTWDDELVPVQNTLLLMESLIKKGISTECHIFEKGRHGLSMADWYTVDKEGWGTEPNCQVWIELVRKWMNYYITTQDVD